MLLRGLPPESQYATALRDDMPELTTEIPEPLEQSYGPWSRAEMLLAAAVDGINILAWQQVVMNKKGAKPPPPKPIFRPGVKRSTGISTKAVNYLQQRREHYARERGETE